MATKELTITEAARRLGISVQAVHEAISKGKLKARRGKIVKVVWLVSEKTLRDYTVSISHQRRGRKKPTP